MLEEVSIYCIVVAARPEDIMLISLPIILFCTSPYCSLLFSMLFPIIPHYANINYSHNHISYTLKKNVLLVAL